jgi:RNA-directed DNA polymerase
MTVCKNTDAVPTPGEQWDSMNWDQAHHVVMRLQVRIAKATREKRWRKVKALQWLLTHTYSAKAIAIKKITTNQGKRAPGVDGIVLKSSEEKALRINSLKRRDYHPLPLRRIYIPKAGNKKKLRPLGIPTMRERGMQALYTFALLPMSETTADWNSYGFRPERSTADAIEALFKKLCRKDAPEWILEGDIKGCFDNISHEWMLKNICTDTTVLEKWLKAGYMEKAELFPTEKGTPQGGIPSPTLANLVLDGIEDLLGRHYNALNRYGKRKQLSPHGIHFVRYANDFVVIAKSRDTLEKEVYPMIGMFLGERGLELSKDNGYRHTIKAMATATQEALIQKLNPKIIGWANYHRSAVSKEIYAKVDNEIWKALWKWSVRRHPNKNKGWIHAKYFRKIKERNHCFSCEVKNESGNGGMLFTLVYASNTTIKRHTKIKIEATCNR